MIEINLLSVWIPTLISVIYLSVFAFTKGYPRFNDLEWAEKAHIFFYVSLLWNIWFILKELIK